MESSGSSELGLETMEIFHHFGSDPPEDLGIHDEMEAPLTEHEALSTQVQGHKEDQMGKTVFEDCEVRTQVFLDYRPSVSQAKTMRLVS